MAENSKIEWTDHTFNPWVGCEKVSPACAHCYAESWAKRAGDPQLWHGERRRTSLSNWFKPIKWDSMAAAAGVRYKVFCASLADVFDNAVPKAWRYDLFALIHKTPNLDWLLLTKRIGNARTMLNESAGFALDTIPGDTPWDRAPWPNVWIGSTVVTQDEYERDIGKLHNTPAAKRFLSIEPLLEPIDLFTYPETMYPSGPERCCSGRECGCMGQPIDPPALYGIDWVIVGGESGGGARAMHQNWARAIRDQCIHAGVAFLFKQWGEFAPSDPKATHTEMTRVGKKEAGRLLDGRTWDQFPA